MSGRPVRRLGFETVSDPRSTKRIPGGRFRQLILEDEWVDVGEEGIKDFGKRVGESVAQCQAIAPPDIAGLAEFSEPLERRPERGELYSAIASHLDEGAACHDLGIRMSAGQLVDVAKSRHLVFAVERCSAVTAFSARTMVIG